MGSLAGFPVPILDLDLIVVGLVAGYSIDHFSLPTVDLSLEGYQVTGHICAGRHYAEILREVEVRIEDNSGVARRVKITLRTAVPCLCAWLRSI